MFSVKDEKGSLSNFEEIWNTERIPEEGSVALRKIAT